MTVDADKSQDKSHTGFIPGLGKFIMLVSNDLFRHDEVGLGK
jgi:hypothetical protein